jgi:hypothetical protein
MENVFQTQEITTANNMKEDKLVWSVGGREGAGTGTAANKQGGMFGLCHNYLILNMF